ncbi:MAG TPA: type II toxin-antitoxin system VapB family antitoxin [Thermoanaerobaculia bacterium]|nr:type II toxin-antitoxin system VapB family antitoxin [Thermoanaerobaculia bacterium]
MKRTNLVLDEKFLEEVDRISGEATYSRAVTRAIEDYLRRIGQGRLLEFAGAWEGNLFRRGEEAWSSETIGAGNDDSSSLH